eukprot:TRINITY_DN9697_c0_g1_i12.p1 TRINITY_DN9697_c0_g1~~TRINITY_DN9697_c0_g1_i12.p1  ORF type:complete len:136 (-),score=13.03 TRINITY_DN9697_c0_g1_i12:3-377(-)
MRARFTAPGTHICWYELEWNPSSVAWSAFRAEFIGATEPVQAEPGSLRGTILRQWVSLGLASEPSTGENGVHASASPLEGLAEKVNWLGVSLAQLSVPSSLVPQSPCRRSLAPCVGQYCGNGSA